MSRSLNASELARVRRLLAERRVEGGPTWALEQALAALTMCDEVNARLARGEPRQGVLW